MTRMPITWEGRLGLVLVLMPLFSTRAALAQSTAGSSEPAGWMETWAGVYAAQDPAGRQAPPGFKVVNPQNGLDDVIIAHSQPWILARREATDFEVEDLGQLCKPTGLFRGDQVGSFELLVSPGRITMLRGEGTGIDPRSTRRIYLNRPHLKNPPLTVHGDAVAHWEGDTLVIDSIGFNDQSWLSPDRTRHSEALHVVERWRFVANGEYLEKTYIVDDLLALTSSYTFTRYHKKLPAATSTTEKLCIDTPEGRRAWLKLHNRAVKEWEESRAASTSESQK